MAAGVSLRESEKALGHTPPRVHASPAGGAATAVFAGQIEDLDENTKTRGDKWRGTPGSIGEAHKMLTDPHVRTGRDSVVDPVIAGAWDFEPGGKRPIDIEAAAFARWVFLKRTPWKKHVGELMRAYMTDGFAIVEKTDDVAPIPVGQFPLHKMSKGTGLGVVVTGLHVRPGWSIDAWDGDPSDAERVRGVRQFLQGSDVENAGFVDIASDRFLRFTWEQVGANYEGSAPQRCVWGPWFVKRLLTRIETMGHERNHIGTPVGKRDESGNGSEDGDKKLLKILESFRAHEKGAIVLEPGYELTWSEHGQQTNVHETITRCNFDIAHGSGGSGFRLLGQAEGPGSHALAGTLQGQFDLGLYKHADFICDVFNFGSDGWSYVARIIRLNYGDDVAIPELVVRYLPTVDFIKTLPLAAELVTAGIMTKDGLNSWARTGLKAPASEGDTSLNEDPRAAHGNIGAGQDIQSQLPNGAQITAGAAIVAQVTKGEISRQSGRAMLIQFFGVSPDIADAMLGPEGFEAKPAPIKQAAPPRPADDPNADAPPQRKAA